MKIKKSTRFGLGIANALSDHCGMYRNKQAYCSPKPCTDSQSTVPLQPSIHHLLLIKVFRQLNCHLSASIRQMTIIHPAWPTAKNVPAGDSLCSGLL